MWYVGLDVHQRQSTVCILSERGAKVKECTVRGPWKKVLEMLAKLDHPFKVCYEACCGYGYLYERLARISRRVVVAHPGQLRLIFRTKKKNDRVDAAKLAMLLLMDQVPIVYVPSVDVRSWRSLIEYRHRLVGKRVRAKNGLRALLRGCGIQAPRGTRLWTGKALAWLRTLTLPGDAEALQRDLLLEELEQYGRQIQRVEKELSRMADRCPGVCLLRTIPGVGPRTAEAVVAYIDKADRFSRNKSIGAYFGLVPSQDASASVNRLGHITGQGPGTVRKLLVEAVWQGIRRCPRIRAYFDRIMQGKQDRKKIALVATAHYLVRVMHAMLTTGEVWRDEAA